MGGLEGDGGDPISLAVAGLRTISCANECYAASVRLLTVSAWNDMRPSRLYRMKEQTLLLSLTTTSAELD